MIEIKPTCDRKTKFWKNQCNTFGLLPGLPDSGGTCPGATCGDGGCCHTPKNRKLPVCYVFGIMSVYKGVKNVLDHNTGILEQSEAELVKSLEHEFSRFQEIELARPDPMLFYRLHWSGDIFNKKYARALAKAMLKFPKITFWAYTRSFHGSFDYAVELANAVPNLMLYLSLDACNLRKGLNTFYAYQSNARYNNLQICYMSKTDNFQQQYLELAKREKHWPAEPPKLRVCPVDAGKLALEYGCFRCQGCVNAKRKAAPVWFRA